MKKRLGIETETEEEQQSENLSLLSVTTTEIENAGNHNHTFNNHNLSVNNIALSKNLNSGPFKYKSATPTPKKMPEGYEKEIIHQKSKVLLVGFGGASCSGKSTLSSILNLLLGQAFTRIVHQDAFFKHDDEIPKISLGKEAFEFEDIQIKAAADMSMSTRFKMAKSVSQSCIYPDLSDNAQFVEGIDDGSKGKSGAQFVEGIDGSKTKSDVAVNNYNHTKDGKKNNQVFVSNWDSPLALSMDLWHNHLKQLRTTAVSPGALSPNRPTIPDETLRFLQSVEPIATLVSNLSSLLKTHSMTLYLVDGFLLYTPPTPYLDLSFFFTADIKTLWKRRRDRANYQTSKGVWQDPPGYFWVVWTEYLRNNQSVFQALDSKTSKWNHQLGAKGRVVSVSSERERGVEKVIEQVLEELIRVVKENI